MTIEIRPITRDDAIAYLKVLPFANGLPSWEPAPAAWHGGPEVWPAPSGPASADELERLAEQVMAEGYRSQAAFVDGVLVGATAMLSLGITVPGLRGAPIGGVTSTGVTVTHRRRGLLRAMMQAMFDDAVVRGEPLAGLSASEGGIYGRFGFSPATLRVRWELERSAAAQLDTTPAPGSLELVDAATARATWPRLHDRARRTRVGELTPPPGHWDDLTDTGDGPAGPLRYLIHRNPDGDIDGIANYRQPWTPDPAHAGTLVVEALDALTPDAYRALWTLLTDVDLTRTIVAPGRPADEPLRWLLRDPRAMRITRQSENLWLRILDLPRALEARGYAITARLTLAVDHDPMCPGNAGVWELDCSPEGATCRRVDSPPDLSIDIRALASLYLGGMSAATLTAAGLIRPHRAHAVNDLARTFRTDPEPFNSLGF